MIQRNERKIVRHGPGQNIARKALVLRRCLKTVNDVDEVTLDGRLYRTCKAVTGKARSPMVEWRIGGTTSVDIDAGLNRYCDLRGGRTATLHRQALRMLMLRLQYRARSTQWP